MAQGMDLGGAPPVIGLTGRKQPAGPMAIPVVRDDLVETFYVDTYGAN